MYFSIREKKILSLLLDYPNGITSEELQDILTNGLPRDLKYRKDD